MVPFYTDRLFDGWTPVFERTFDASSELPLSETVYVWGTDLSGSMQGAGGVGGLLAVKRDGVWYAPLYDANGNVTAYVSETGAVVAEYEYDAFGNTLTQSGSLADSFRHRFSTKPWIAALGVYDYGERVYSPELRRWLSRDPIGEDGGLNLYAMCGNDTANAVDTIGLSYYYSIYFGVGHPQYNPTLRKAADVIVSMMKKYIPPADAVNNRKCLLQVASNITSGALREASKSYDELYFAGHGALRRTLNMNRKAGESMKNFYSQSVTVVTFADGDYRLSDVLTASKKEVKSKILYADVCYDAFLDMKNPSCVPVVGVSKSTAPVQSIGLKIDIDQIKRSFAAKKCCSVEVRRK